MKQIKTSEVFPIGCILNTQEKRRSNGWVSKSGRFCVHILKCALNTCVRKFARLVRAFQTVMKSSKSLPITINSFFIEKPDLGQNSFYKDRNNFINENSFYQLAMTLTFDWPWLCPSSPPPLIVTKNYKMYLIVTCFELGSPNLAAVQRWSNF